MYKYIEHHVKKIHVYKYLYVYIVYTVFMYVHVYIYIKSGKYIYDVCMYIYCINVCLYKI